MPLNFQTFTVPLVAGLDTKSHPMTLEAPKLVTALNCDFSEPGAIAKRPGFTAMGLTTAAGGSITASRGRALGTRRNELVYFAEGRAYARSEADDEWQDRGRYESVLVAQETVHFTSADQVLPDRAEYNGVIVRAWEDRKANAVKYAVTDKTTGTPFQVAATVSIASAQQPKCIALNGRLLVIYFDAGGVSGTVGLLVDVIDPADVYGTLGVNPVAIAATASCPTFDVVVDGANSATVAYSDGTNAVVKKITSAGAVTATNATARACDTAIAIDYHSGSNRFALVRYKEAGTNEVRLDWLTGAIADDAANIDRLIVSLGASLANNVAVASLAGQTAYVFWDLVVTGGIGSPQDDRVYRAQATAAGLVAGTDDDVLVRRSRIGSRALRWSDGAVERVLIHVAHMSTLQSMYVLVDAGFVVGNTNGGAIAATDEVGLLARLFPGEGPSGPTTYVAAGAVGGLYRKGCLPHIESLGSNQYAVALTFRRFTDTSRSPAGKLRAYTERGIREVVYTAFDSRAFRGAQEGSALYLPGGYGLAMYDGERVYEGGLWLFPEGCAGTDGGAGTGSIAAGTYQYRWFYEWDTAQGERERSSYSGNVQVVVAAGTSSTTWVLPCLPYTNKQNVRIVGYRTEAGQADRFYCIASFDPVSGASGTPAYVAFNNVNADTVTTFVDRVADADLTGRVQDYISAGELDAVPPPATPFVAAGQGRIFTRDTEDPYLIHYSKIRIPGRAVEGNDALQIRTPQDGGAITGVVITEGALIILSTLAVYVANGGGLSNTGGAPDYGEPQRIGDVGCSDVRSIVRTPAGIFFKSAKGIHRIAASGGGVDYVGAGVEDYNTATITGAVHVPDKHQVRFLTSSSGMLVYDYYVNAWSVWTDAGLTGRSGLSMVIARDTVYHLETAGPFEPSGTYLDGSTGYPLQIKTGAIRLAGLAEYQRLRWLFVVGEWITSHDLAVTITDDGANAMGSATFADVASTSPYRVRVTPATRALSPAVQVTVQDATPSAGGTWGASLKLIALELHLGLRLGGSRLPSAQTK